jgi:hypothetical protein
MILHGLRPPSLAVVGIARGSASGEKKKRKQINARMKVAIGLRGDRSTCWIYGVKAYSTTNSPFEDNLLERLLIEEVSLNLQHPLASTERQKKRAWETR